VRAVRHGRRLRRPDYADLFADWRWNMTEPEMKSEASIKTAHQKTPKAETTTTNHDVVSERANFKCDKIIFKVGNRHSLKRKSARAATAEKVKKGLMRKCFAKQPMGRKRGN
jgi:hypothetical protein